MRSSKESPYPNRGAPVGCRGDAAAARLRNQVRETTQMPPKSHTGPTYPIDRAGAHCTVMPQSAMYDKPSFRRPNGARQGHRIKLYAVGISSLHEAHRP